MGRRGNPAVEKSARPVWRGRSLPRRAESRVEAAAAALDRGRERDALRMLEPVRRETPDAPSVLSLRGLALYRLGRYAAAAKELEELRHDTEWAELMPVLMDCRRAQKRHGAVDKLWDELRATSPGAAIVAEGRIVMAGSKADRGKLEEAIALLERAPRPKGRAREHNIRITYALADLYERAGDLPRARALFEQVRAAQSDFADVAERLMVLS